MQFDRLTLGPSTPKKKVLFTPGRIHFDPEEYLDQRTAAPRVITFDDLGLNLDEDHRVIHRYGCSVVRPRRQEIDVDLQSQSSAIVHFANDRRGDVLSPWTTYDEDQLVHLPQSTPIARYSSFTLVSPLPLRRPAMVETNLIHRFPSKENLPSSLANYSLVFYRFPPR